MKKLLQVLQGSALGPNFSNIRTQKRGVNNEVTKFTEITKFFLELTVRTNR